MNKVAVDLGISARDGRYTIQLKVMDVQVDLTPDEASSLMADLATATALTLGQATSDGEVARAPRATYRPSPRGKVRWTRKRTSDYVTHLPGLDQPAEVYLGEKGWVAVVGDTVLHDAVRSKGAAQEEVLKYMNERLAERQREAASSGS